MTLSFLHQCRDILLDWRSNIGNASLVAVQNFFSEHKLTAQEIVEYVEYTYNPAGNVFNFIYRDAEAPVVCIC